MNFYSAHLKAGAAPVLVREGFCWAAFLLGPLWLAAHRSWIPAALSLAAYVLVAVLAPPGPRAIIALGLCWLMGLCGHDLHRWSLALRGYKMPQIIAARDSDEALHRLLLRAPDAAAAFRPGFA